MTASNLAAIAATCIGRGSSPRLAASNGIRRQRAMRIRFARGRLREHRT